MILDRTRAFPLLLFLWTAVTPAAAQFTRSGSLNWRWDDFTVNSGSGRFHDTEWAQAYDLAVMGPLLNPAVGTLRSNFAFSDGANISQAANTGIPHQQQMSYGVMADFFRPELQRLIRFSPNFSRSLLRQSGGPGVGPSRETLNTAWGFSTGLSLPLLPAVNYSRQVNTLATPSEISPVNTRSTTESKTASYTLFRHAVMSVSQQTSRIVDNSGAVAPTDYDYRKADLEANYYEPKWIGLQTLYFRGDLARTATNGLVGQKQATSGLNFTTHKFRTGLWQSYLVYGNNFARDFIRERDTFAHDLSLQSTRPIRTGTLGNSLALNQSPTAPSEGASDALSLNQTFRQGSLTTSMNGSGGWNRGPGTTLLSDGFSEQLNICPTRPDNGFVQVRTSGSKALRGAGGGRTNTLSIGSNHARSAGSIGTRIDHIDAKSYADGTRSVSDQLQLDAKGNPIPRLYSTFGYNLGMVRTAPGHGSRTSQSLRAGLDYEPWSGFSLSASAAYAGVGYSTLASVAYSLGKTALKISYEYRSVSTPMTFSHLSISLTRTL